MSFLFFPFSSNFIASSIPICLQKHVTDHYIYAFTVRVAIYQIGVRNFDLKNTCLTSMTGFFVAL